MQDPSPMIHSTALALCMAFMTSALDWEAYLLDAGHLGPLVKQLCNSLPVEDVQVHICEVCADLQLTKGLHSAWR